MHQSWLSPLAVCRPAGAKGLGIFAVDAIPAGTTVAGFGGCVVDRAELDALDEKSASTRSRSTTTCSSRASCRSTTPTT